jgi:class 3 adenylate cyclase
MLRRWVPERRGYGLENDRRPIRVELVADGCGDRVACGTAVRSMGDVSADATLTYLYSDVEGSTRLWERHPKAM